MLKVFTTRPDTIFGASFVALSVDHPLNKEFNQNKTFLEFKNECNKSGTTEEALANAEKLDSIQNYLLNTLLSKEKKYQSFLLILS